MDDVITHHFADHREEILSATVCRQPTPRVPGDTDSQRMSNALRMMLTVSKLELQEGSTVKTGRREEVGSETAS